MVLRFKAYGWHTEVIEDLDGIEAAIQRCHSIEGTPSLISFKTTSGFGSELYFSIGLDSCQQYIAISYRLYHVYLDTPGHFPAFYNVQRFDWLLVDADTKRSEAQLPAFLSI
jgi:hypothetical protein